MATNDNNRRRKFYDQLSTDYDLGSFEEFDTKMNDAASRRRLYDAIDADGKYDIGTYDYFDEAMRPAAPSVPAGDATGTADPENSAAPSQQTEQQPAENSPTFEVGGNGYTFTADELQKMEEGQRPVMKPKYGTPEYGSQKIEGDASNPYAGMTRQQAINAVGKKFFNEWYGKDHTPETTEEVDGEQVKYGGLGAYDQIRAELAANNIVDPENYANVTKDIRRAYIPEVARRRIQQLMGGFESANHWNAEDIRNVLDSREAQQAINQDLERLGFAPTPEAYDGDQQAMHRDIQRYEQARQYYYKQLENELENVLVNKYGWLPSKDYRSGVESFRDELISGGAEEHEERIRDREALNMVTKYATPQVQKYFNEAEEKGREAYRQALNSVPGVSQASAGTYQNNMGNALGAALYAGYAENKETDPGKIWAAMEPNLKQMGINLINDPGFMKEAETRAAEEGMELGDYLRLRVDPVLESIYRKEFERIAVENEMPKNFLQYALGKMRESLPGMLINAAFTSQARRRAQQRAMQLTDVGQGKWTPNIYGRMGGGFLGTVPDLALFGAVGKAVAPVGGAVTQELSSAGFRPLVSRLAGASITNAGTMGGAEAVKGFAEGLLNDNDYEHITDKDDRSFLDVLGDAVKTAVERSVPSFVSGAAMVGNPIAGKIFNGTRGIISKSLKIGTQALTDAAGSTFVSVISGDIKPEDAGEHFFENFGTFIALALQGHAKEIKKLGNGNTSWNGVEFTEKDTRALEDLGLDKFRNLMKDIERARNRKGLIGQSLGLEATKEQVEAAKSEGAKLYNEMMRSYAIPYELKKKVAQAMDAPIPDYAVKPEVLELSARVPAESVDLGLVDMLEYEYNREGGVADKVKQGQELDSNELNLRLLFQENKAFNEAVEKLQRGEELTDEEQSLIVRNQRRLNDVQTQYYRLEHERVNREFETEHGLEPGTMNRLLRDVAEGKAINEANIMKEYEEYLRGVDQRLGDARAEIEARKAAEAEAMAEAEKQAVENTEEQVGGVPENESINKAEVVTENETTPPPPLVMDEKGEVLWEQSPVEATVAGLTERVGKERVGQIVDEEIASLTDELTSLSERRVKNMNERLQREQDIADVAERMVYWQQVKDAIAPKEEAAKPEEAQKPAEPEAPVVEQEPEEQKPAEAETPVEGEAPAAPDQPITPPEDAERPAELTAEQKVAQGTVNNNTGKRFGFQNQDGSRSEIVIDGIGEDGKVEVTRQDYDADGRETGDPYKQSLDMVSVGNSIVNGTMKPALATEEKLRQVHKFDKFKVGDVPLIDVLTDAEQRQVLEALERGDTEAVGNMTPDLIKAHHEDLILKGRDDRNAKVRSIMEGNGSREQKLRKVRELYKDYEDAEVSLEDATLAPTTLEEYVADLHSRVPKSGEGPIAYFSYKQGDTEVTGLQDESGYGKKSSGDADAFKPWLAPKGKGMSLMKYAEQIHSQLPEEIQKQFDVNDVRNAILDVFSAAERPSDITTMILKRGVEQAEQAVRRMEDNWIEGGPSYQKVSADDNSFAGRLTRAKEQTNAEPTEKQKAAGNFKKGHVSFGGYDFVVENPEGSVRRGEADGRKWENKMNNTYGYILGKRGKDGDHLDMFINDAQDLDNFDGKVYVIDQVNPKTGEFDESKILYGFDSEEAARDAYLSNYEEGWQGLGRITGVDKETFDKWLDSSDRQIKAFAEHSIIRDALSKPEVKQAVTDAEIDKALVTELDNELKNAGVPLVDNAEEGQAVLDAVNGEAKMMGTTTRTRQNNIASELKDKELSAEQQTVVDVFTGKDNQALLKIEDVKGKERSILFTQGNDKKAGAKHSIFRHNGTNKNWYTAEEVTLIPDVIHQGKRTQEGNRVSYTLDKDGVKFTVTTLITGKKEKFTNFFTNRKPNAAEQGTQNTANQRVQPQQSDSDAKVQDNFETGKRSEEKINLQKVEEMKERETKRDEEQSKLIFDTSKKLFGTTRDIREAGYILPDGIMLDFSGRHEMDPGSDTSFLRGRRSTDHREIKMIAYERDGNTETGIKTDMPDFIRRGAIRIDDNAGTINLYMMPTAKQKTMLRQLIARNDGYVQVDFGDGWDSEHYVEYDGAKPARVLADIDRYFNEGVVPKGDAGEMPRYQKVDNNPVFYSNAMKAVEGIKQEKATPEQWLAMITKAGGLKAGEDKWLGLSDWLKEQKGSVTKQDVLDYIRKNQIEVEEEHYGEGMSKEAQEKLDAFNAEFEELIWEGEEATGSIYTSDWVDWAYKQMVERYGEDFESAFDIGEGTGTNSKLTPSTDMYDELSGPAKYYLGIDAGTEKPINSTRLDYTTDGLENKREIVLVVPTIEPWNESDEIHFGDAGDGRAVAWVRFGDAYAPNMGGDPNSLSDGVSKVLVIDEIQSKRHQEGREKGYKDLSAYTAKLDDKTGRWFIYKNGEKVNEQYYREGQTAEQVAADYARQFEDGIPDAPFEKNWHELAMKRMLRYAAENGYDKIAWTKGEQQAERYNIGNVVDKVISYDYPAIADTDGRKSRKVEVRLKDGETMTMRVDQNGKVIEGRSDTEGKMLSDVVGKDLAKSIMSGEGKDGTMWDANRDLPAKILEGDGLRIGGEGMKGFYDQILPRFMDKYGKKWGVKTGEIELPDVEPSARKMWSVDVTPEMKESVMQGQPMFFKTPEGHAYGFTYKGKIYVDPRIATAETPIHEYGHLWAEMKRQTSPKEWDAIKEALLNDKAVDPLIDKVRREYPELLGEGREDDFIEEVLTQFSGKHGAERLRRMAEEIKAELGGDATAETIAQAAIRRVKSVLNDFWKSICNMMGWKYTNAEDVADTILRDMLNGVSPNEVIAKAREGRAAENPRIKPQLVGEKGAAEADKAENSTTRQDSKAVAEEMEKEGKDAKAIKFATGWERGKDGKWRYETTDAKVDILTPYEKRVAEMKEAGIDDPSPVFKLSELMGKDNELFKYYPKLKDMEVMIGDFLPDGVAGSFDGSKIELNAKETNRIGDRDLDNESVYGTLLHEVQHAVQEIEGFAKGGNLSTATTEEGLQAIVDKKQQQRADLKLHMDANNKMLNDAEELKAGAELAGMDDDAFFENLVDKNDEMAVEYDRLGMQIDRINKLKTVSKSDAIALYNSLAGEVEARNVSERAYMSDEQRRKKPAFDTEDTHRDEQVVITNNDGKSSSMGDGPETFEERQKRAVREKGVVRPGLGDESVNAVQIKEHTYTGDIKEATRQAAAAAKKKYAPDGKPAVQHYDNYGKKFEYIISGRAISESLNPKQQAKSENKGAHLSMAEHLDEIINNSIEVEEHPDYPKNENGERDGSIVNPNALMHRFYGVVEIDGKPYRVMTLMREDKTPQNKDGLYAYEVQKIEVLNDETPSTANGVDSTKPESLTYPLAKILQNIEKSKDSGKYLLDESKRITDIDNNGEENAGGKGKDAVDRMLDEVERRKRKDTEDVIAELSEPAQSDAATDASKPQVPDENGGELINAEAQVSSSVGKGKKNNDTLQINGEENAGKNNGGVKYQRVEGSPEPEMTPEERQYWKKYEADLKKWKAHNGLKEDAQEPMTVPRMNAGESATDYAKRVMEYAKEKAKWKTAPHVEDYRQRRLDKDMLEEAREEEKRYPDSQRAKMRRAAAEFQQIRTRIGQQKAYDKATVKAVTDFAQDFMKMGFGDNLTNGEISRLLSSVKNATGASTVKKEVDNIMNILMDNYLRNLENRLVKLSSVKELNQTAQGVEKQGKLELKGQRMIQAFREARQGRWDAETLRERLSEIDENIDRDEEGAEMWEQEREGVEIALQYAENIEESRQEWEALNSEYKDAEKNYRASGRTYQEQQELLDGLERAMQENKMERIAMYGDIMGRLQGNIDESVQGAKEFRERERERTKLIHAIANFDTAGMDMSAFRSGKDEKGRRASLFFSPLGTFEQMLKQFGARNAKGEGYLYDYFMRNWMDSTNRAYEGEEHAKMELDEKAQEVFGDEKVRRWSDLYKLVQDEKKMPGMEVEVVDQGERKQLHLTQGNMLYIYMANKMNDGAMKLRKMGITEEDVAKIKENLDERLVELGDWLQDEYLPAKRVKYNQVHERMFGAPMAAIDHYFPIKVLGDARQQDVDMNDAFNKNALPSTITGSIIKRKKNTLPLDILHTDALSLAIEHIEDMEQWAAMAEWKKDISTLLSYTTFRNKVKNMKTIYGSGNELWRNFFDAASIAAGEYQPKRGDADKAVTNIAKGVTSAKINFRLYTAFKQILSAPAFLHDVRLDDFIKNSVNPYGSWKWAMENMPVFRKRVNSRKAGDTRLEDTEEDWKLWKSNFMKLATRYGMSANAFVDAVTCAVGARSIYETRYRKYLKMGADEEKAHQRAMQDAEIGYNLTQQSSEGAFVSKIQKDRTVAANMLSVFRNGPMAYGRQEYDAYRNLKRMLKADSEEKEDRINFMAKQLEEGLGLNSEQAQEAARKQYNRAMWHELGKLMNMAFGVTVAWNLGASLPYLLVGDDWETKEEMLKDAVLKGIAGPVEGFAGGNLISDMVSLATNKDVRNAFGESFEEGVSTARKSLSNYEINPLPLLADLDRLMGKSGGDVYEFANDLFNIWAQSNLGFNPQTFTDFWNACVDYGFVDNIPLLGAGVDPSLHNQKGLLNAREIALFLMRATNAPTSSWKNKLIDELGADINIVEAKRVPYDELARRYANYKGWKDSGLAGIVREYLGSDESREGMLKKKEQQFKKAVQERLDNLSNQEVIDLDVKRQDDSGLHEAVKKQLDKRAEKMSEEELQYLFDNVFLIDERKTVGKELASRLGFDGKKDEDGKKEVPTASDADYFMRYHNSGDNENIKKSKTFYVTERSWADIAEDLELEVIKRDAKAAGDEATAKAVDNAKQSMLNYIRQLGANEWTKWDGTVVDEEYRWSEIRRIRHETLEKLRGGE